MAINATTLSAAVGTTDTVFSIASQTGVTAPNYQVGDPLKGISGGVTYGFVEQEIVKVTGLVSTTGCTVVRGELGTVASAHGASAPIIFGLPSDFPNFQPALQSAVPAYPIKFQGWSAPVAGGNTNVATGPYFHLTGTTIMKTLTAPAGVVEGGEVTIVFDGSGAGLTWDATGNIAVAGTATTAASAVTFVFDSGSGKWHPSRLA